MEGPPFPWLLAAVKGGAETPALLVVYLGVLVFPSRRWGGSVRALFG